MWPVRAGHRAAYPLAHSFRTDLDITVLFNQVVDFDLAQRRVVMEHGTLAYDYLGAGAGEPARFTSAIRNGNSSRPG